MKKIFTTIRVFSVKIGDNNTEIRTQRMTLHSASFI